jgi:hypothetical protein
MNRHKITDTHEHSACIFAAKADSRIIDPQAPEDIASAVDCIWVTKEELLKLKETDKRLGIDTFRYALSALNVVGGGESVLS